MSIKRYLIKSIKKMKSDQKKIYLFLIILLLLLIVVGVDYFYLQQKKPQPDTTTTTPTEPTSNPTVMPSNTTAPQASAEFSPPIDQFAERITKKFFGTYITAQNSPVQPERFKGFHTGVDVEYSDVTTDVSVYALADGKIVYSKIVSGYGGVFIMEFSLNGSPHTALYGHIRPSSLPRQGATTTKGEKLAGLGTGYSSETNGERRHLHFAILSDNQINLLGYVQQKSQLSNWIDPMSLY